MCSLVNRMCIYFSFQIKLAFGGRVRLMLSGAAPLPKHVEEFLRVTCCCSLSQGYGIEFLLHYCYFFITFLSAYFDILFFIVRAY